MKKEIIAGLGIFSLVGCVNNIGTITETPEQIKQYAETYAQELEQSKDIIAVIEAYQKDYRPWGCFAGEESKRCVLAATLAEPGKLDNYKCFDTTDQSDECVLFRRDNKYETEVQYFDYKRFLGKNSRIKNDAMFKMFLDVYQDIENCDKEQGITSVEKEECRQRQEKYIRLAAKQRIPCKKFVELQYKEELKKNIRHYRFWVMSMGHSHYDIIENTDRFFRKFADKYKCDVSDWENDMFE